MAIGSVYSNCATLAVGCFVYSNSTKTTPVSNGYLSRAGTCYTIINGTGYISAISACPTPTPTPAPTATPTPTTAGFYYTANRYDCSGPGLTCSNALETGICIQNLGPITIFNRYYLDNTSFDIFYVTGTASPGACTITTLDNISPSTTCSTLCAF